MLAKDWAEKAIVEVNEVGGVVICSSGRICPSKGGVSGVFGDVAFAGTLQV